MTFPVWLDLFGLRIHPHPVLEGLGYFAGARLYFALRRRHPSSALPLETTLWLFVGVLFGAFFGSKLLAWLESPDLYFGTGDVRDLEGGKTIIGAILGGWLGVEIAKRACGVRRQTGDLFVYPLALGTAIGRIGCFLTGLSDHTYGIATTLPWGVDFGDGVYRHPTQLYESLFVLCWAALLWIATRRRQLPSGALFRLYVAGYFAWRFFIEFIKPREIFLAGLSVLQVTSLAGLAFCLFSLWRLSRPPAPIPNPVQ